MFFLSIDKPLQKSYFYNTINTKGLNWVCPLKPPHDKDFLLETKKIGFKGLVTNY